MNHNELVSVSNGLLELDLRSPSIARSLDGSLGRSLDHRSLSRSIARSLGRSVGRSLDRSVARSLGCSVARSLGRPKEWLWRCIFGQLCTEVYRGPIRFQGSYAWWVEDSLHVMCAALPAYANSELVDGSPRNLAEWEVFEVWFLAFWESRVWHQGFDSEFS